MTEIMPVPRNLILLSYQQGAQACPFLRSSGERSQTAVSNAAPRVRRSTEEARVSGDRSLSNQRGPRKIEDFVGCTAALGPSGPRRECGVERRAPVDRATGVYQMKRGPCKIKILRGTKIQRSDFAPVVLPFARLFFRIYFEKPMASF